MNLKLANLLLIIFVAFIALAGCEKAQRLVTDGVPADPATDETMIDMETTPVRLVWLIDYPADGKDAYLAWVASIAATLQAPEEIVRIRSYDNRDAEASPSRLVEFEFNSFLDAATYLNRPEIAAILEDLPNHSSHATVHTFIQRSDYTAGEEGNWEQKSILLIDYPLGGKDAYLEWVASISSILIEPPELKRASSYDNYYGESPHRLVSFEFETIEDADAYEAREEIAAIEMELHNRAGSSTRHDFELRSDYINE